MTFYLIFVYLTNFEYPSFLVLVLDEADRILDTGFASTINAIIENLPKTRQTLLFSATQTKSVRDLARLSLKDPEYVAVHEKANEATPTKLTQKYLICELHRKLDVLFSFLKTHTKSKIIIFVSSCKQVNLLCSFLNPLLIMVLLFSMISHNSFLSFSSFWFFKKNRFALYLKHFVNCNLVYPFFVFTENRNNQKEW